VSNGLIVAENVVPATLLSMVSLIQVNSELTVVAMVVQLALSYVVMVCLTDLKKALIVEALTVTHVQHAQMAK
jgi:hypothetical protein